MVTGETDTEDKILDTTANWKITSEKQQANPRFCIFQGLCKFGLYELFKVKYAEIIGEENAYLYRTSLYLAASASAEFFADIALAPFEAAKVKIQTIPGYANNFREAVPKMLKEEGVNAFYKGLVPLWMRQIPYTMMKFACFERTVELLYK